MGRFFLSQEPERMALFQVSSDNGDEIACRFFRRFGIPGHMVADVVFHQFSHQTVDGPASGGQALQHFRALLVIIQSPENSLELADDFFGAVYQINFFRGAMGHPGHAYPMGV